MDIAQEMLTKFNNDYLYFDVNNDARHGRPSTSTTDENMEAVKKIILDNCWEAAHDPGISFGSCQAIFTDV